MHEVIETTRKVSRRSRFVRIDPDAVIRFARTGAEKTIEIPPWDTHCHFSGPEDLTVSYILVLDTINFCFWPESGSRRWEIAVDGRHFSGYHGLAMALKQAFESDSALADAGFLERLTRRDLETILGGRGSLQLLEERVAALNELGRILNTVYNGKATRLAEAANGSATALARLAAKHLSSFNDVAVYENETVYFYKRAQILAADLYGALKGAGWGSFGDMEQLTAFADYKLPQVLRALGILQYGPELARTVDHQALLQPGSPEEVEIRANTIWAVETIRRELGKMGKNLKAHEIDWLLWTMGQDEKYRAKPYHRTKTIFY
jgi:hypothetical protein